MQTKRGFSRWVTWLLLGMLVVNILLYGAAFIINKRNKTAERLPPTAAEPPFSLQDAYSQSHTVAANWQSDVYLVNATTSWQLTAGDALTLYRPTWSFSFYSPAARKVQTVIFDEKEVQAGRVRPVSIAPHQAGADWNTNSDDLLLIFLSYGGEEFINDHININLHLQLKGENTGSSTWYLTAIDPVARQSLVIGIDAYSRDVILSENNKGG